MLLSEEITTSPDVKEKKRTTADDTESSKGEAGGDVSGIQTPNPIMRNSARVNLLSSLRKRAVSMEHDALQSSYKLQFEATLCT